MPKSTSRSSDMLALDNQFCFALYSASLAMTKTYKPFHPYPARDYFDALVWAADAAYPSLPLKEGMRLKFRGEVFNPFNAPMLDLPGLQVGAGNFGRIQTSAADYQPRSIQFGMRLDF